MWRHSRIAFVREGIRRVRVALLAVPVALAASAAVPAAAEAATPWICKPGMQPNACDGSLATTYLATGVVDTPVAPTRPPIDCFYVYPTVSNQVGPNATATPDPEVRAIAEYQAARFSQQCRVFAPIYRQNTLASLFARLSTPAGRALAYGDVKRAFEEYLDQDNDGRGIVLLGHSQGTGMLRLLIRDTFDKDRGLRKKLVGGVLLGGNVLVKKNQDRGGDFANVPICTDDDQIGCLIAYSLFNETPPTDTAFGRPRNPDFLTGLPPNPDVEVACTNPASLKQNKELEAHPILRSELFTPGLILAGIIQTYGGPPPTAGTPYVVPPDRYTARCVRVNGAHVMMARGIGNARKLRPAPDATWGLHLADVNGGLGDLQDHVQRQSDLYLAGPRLSLKLRYTRAKGSSCAKGAVTASVRGADNKFVRQAKYRVRGKAVAREKKTMLRSRIERARLRAGRLNRVRVVVTLADERTQTLVKNVRACS